MLSNLAFLNEYYEKTANCPHYKKSINKHKTAALNLFTPKAINPNKNICRQRGQDQGQRIFSHINGLCDYAVNTPLIYI